MQEDEVFEWDESKAESNRKKHGITFDEACAIWNDPFFYRVKLCDEPEARWLCVGRVARGVYLSAIITYRSDSIRLISARRSSKMEVEKYHE